MQRKYQTTRWDPKAIYIILSQNLNICLSKSLSPLIQFQKSESVEGICHSLLVDLQSCLVHCLIIFTNKILITDLIPCPYVHAHFGVVIDNQQYRLGFEKKPLQ